MTPNKSEIRAGTLGRQMSFLSMKNDQVVLESAWSLFLSSVYKQSRVLWQCTSAYSLRNYLFLLVSWVFATFRLTLTIYSIWIHFVIINEVIPRKTVLFDVISRGILILFIFRQWRARKFLRLSKIQEILVRTLFWGRWSLNDFFSCIGS